MLLFKFDLIKIQLHGGLASEDTHHHTELHPFLIDILHKAGEVVKWPFRDFHRITDAERNFENLDVFSFFHPANEPFDLISLERGRFVPGANEADHRRGIKDQMLCLLIENRLDKDIAGEECFRLTLFLTLLDFENLVGRHHHVCNSLGEVRVFNFILKMGLDFIFVSGIRTDRIPSFLGIIFAHITSGESSDNKFQDIAYDPINAKNKQRDHTAHRKHDNRGFTQFFLMRPGNFSHLLCNISKERDNFFFHMRSL